MVSALVRNVAKACVNIPELPKMLIAKKQREHWVLCNCSSEEAAAACATATSPIAVPKRARLKSAQVILCVLKSDLRDCCSQPQELLGEVTVSVLEQKQEKTPI